jgi:hypothetical protein
LTAVRSRSWRSLAFVVALATLFALALPFMPKAEAQTTTDNTCTLNVAEDVDSNPTGTTHTLTATVTATSQCNSQTIEVDFEVESGPAVRVNTTGDAGAGGTASDDGNTPNTPDLTCTTALALGAAGDTKSCTVTFTSDTAGTNVVRAWVDNDRDNATADNDPAEGRYAGGADEAFGATTPTPGNRTEPDDTDVVQKTWFGQLPANTVLDCSPEVATNPSTGDGSAETYTCQLYNNNGTPADTTDDSTRATAGITLDAENNGPANDPDDAGFATGGNATADYNDVCTTDANGACTATINSSEAQAGTSLICFWVDNDTDNVYSNAGDENDGANCTGDAGTSEDTGGDGTTRIGAANSNRDDQTDVVQKTWVARGVAAVIDCSPESDQNVRGSQHSVTCKVTDAFGTAVQGASVDFSVTGRNPQSTDNQFTNANGEATLTYTDSNAALTAEGQADTIEGCIESDAGAGCTGPGTDSGDTEDVVSKFWFTTLPSAGSLQLDVNPDVGTGGACETGTAREKTDTNTVDTTHEVCATVTNASGVPLAGQEVTFTTSGPGGFYTDTDADGNVEQGEFTATTFTTQTNAAGQARATIASQTSGTTTITATSGSASDNGTKVWVADRARNIECSPETASNPPGTSHVITCTATDRFGNPTQNTGGATSITVSETGPGRIDSADQDGATAGTQRNLASDGTAEIIVSTTETESGEQSITAELTDDRTGGTDPVDSASDLDDPCDQPAGRNDAGSGADAEATAGNCETTVEKVWEEQVDPQCSDGIDNDGDGLADDADGGCYDEDGNYDPDDNDETNITERTVHPRTVEITKFKHIDLPGKKKPALMVKGQVTVDDGFTECNNFAPVKIQLRASGEWITRKTDFTNENGVFKVLIRHVHGKYRAIASRFELFDQFGNVDVCQRAEDTRRYSH